MIRSNLRGLAGDAGARNPPALAEQLYLLFEGAITASQLHGEPWPADYARQAAQIRANHLFMFSRGPVCWMFRIWKLDAGADESAPIVPF